METISEEQPAILSDWFQQEIYGKDHKTALTKLLSIFDSSLVSLGTEGKRLRDLLDEIKARETAVKVVVLLGESGVGKSSIGNCFSAFILSRDSQ